MSINDEWTDAMHTNISLDRIKNVKQLLENGVNLNTQLRDRMTPLHLAVENGSLEMVKLLLEHGANVNSLSYFGESTLMTATKRGNKEVGQRDVFGEAATYAAIVRRAHPKIVDSLLYAGGTLSDLDVCGRTVVHRLALSTVSGDSKATEYVGDLLSDHQWLADFPDDEAGARTPLHAVAVTGNLQLLSVVLANSGRKDAPALFGVTPSELAVVFDNYYVANTIDRHVDADRLIQRQSMIFGAVKPISKL
ncbi:ankyrin-3-like [Adelges cooleyi]|uniref:ankyrin-3-like n=1 Tax=Adelges cooleyi TaxID=133065 RepID=UPI00217F80CB|nr:ankyrin-3-like [Adelges cooleyi]